MRRGITVQECVQFAVRLQSIGVSGITISGGFKEKAFRTMSRGDIPRQLVLKGRTGVNLVLAKAYLAAMQRASRFEEGYFLRNAATVRRHVTIPVTAVGGLRTLSVMERALQDGHADLIGLSRPLIRSRTSPTR